MPNIKSAKKRVKVIKTKTLRNKQIKSELKTIIKSTKESIKNNTELREKDLKFAMKRIDQAGAKGIYHKNKISRMKSKLQRLNNASAG